MIIGVLVELSNKNIDKVFDYKVPKYLEDDILVGIRVEVPFGKKVLDGFVLEIKNEYESQYELKEIIGIKDREIVLNDELLKLGKIMQENTLATLISCYQVMLPKGLKAKQGTVVNKKYDTYYRVNDNLDDVKLTVKQEEIVDFIKERNIVKKDELKEFSAGIIMTLVKKEILIPEKQEHYRLSYNNELGSKYQLTSDQENVVDEVLKDTSFKPYLLHGVTGSGKTEVYMELIEDALNKGKTSIMLVPEISLTPQMVQRFQKRFGDNIAKTSFSFI